MEATKETALALRADMAPSPYEPRDYGEAMKMAGDFATSKLTKCKTAQQAFLVMATGRELGIPATTALRMIYVADFGQGDQVALSADLMVALCLRSPLCEYFRCVESTNESATYVTRRKGDPERTASFTVADKERAKLGAVGAGKDASLTNWAKYPAVMLRHRAASLLAREVYPDVIGGFYTDDEAREMTTREPVPNVRPLSGVIETTATEVDTPAPPADTDEARLARWTAELRAATSDKAASPTVTEATKLYPDKEHAVRASLRAVYSERKAAKWAVEPPHDPITGVVDERQPGEEG